MRTSHKKAPPLPQMETTHLEIKYAPPPPSTAPPGGGGGPLLQPLAQKQQTLQQKNESQLAAGKVGGTVQQCLIKTS